MTAENGYMISYPYRSISCGEIGRKNGTIKVDDHRNVCNEHVMFIVYSPTFAGEEYNKGGWGKTV